MSPTYNPYLMFAGGVTMLGGLLHVAIIVGGPAWYAFFGAPAVIVRMARAGALYPVIACLVIAAFLFGCAIVAFSGAGVIGRVPLLRSAMLLIASVLIVRAVLFIPLSVLFPRALAGVCDCHGIDLFLVSTSALCLATGAAYAIGARQVWARWSARPTPSRPGR